MKRLCSLALALLLCFGLFGCGRRQEEPKPSADGPEALEPSETPATPEHPEEPDAPGDPGEPAAADSAAPPEITSAESSIVVADPADGETAVLTIDASFPEIGGMERVTDYYRAMQTDLETVYSADAEEAAARREELLSVDGEFSPWQVTMEYEVLRNDGVTLSILRHIYENRGGAYPTVTLRAETFDVASQGRLLLSDLFTVDQTEALRALMAMVWTQMESQSDTVWLVPDVEQLERLYDPLDFALTDDSLVLFFGDSRLAAHAADEQRFDLPLEELSQLLKPEWCLSHEEE